MVHPRLDLLARVTNGKRTDIPAGMLLFHYLIRIKRGVDAPTKGKRRENGRDRVKTAINFSECIWKAAIRYRGGGMRDISRRLR